MIRFPFPSIIPNCWEKCMIHLWKNILQSLHSAVAGADVAVDAVAVATFLVFAVSQFLPLLLFPSSYFLSRSSRERKRHFHFSTSFFLNVSTNPLELSPPVFFFSPFPTFFAQKESLTQSGQTNKQTDTHYMHS